MICNALIFAAGRGERLMPYTKHTPKPLLQIQSLPVIFWHIQKLQQLNIKTIFINHAYLGGQIKSQVKQAFPDLNIQFLAEPPGGLETGGTLAFFEELVGQSSTHLLCINADIFCDYDFDLNITLEDDIHAKLILAPKTKASLQGNFDLDEQGFIQQSLEPEFIFTGIAYYNLKAIHELPLGRYSIREYLFKWLAQKQVKGEVYQGPWFDIGDVNTLLKLK
jgi:MurNAc alpha-1-phosphate uridylyltransferase